MFALRPPLKTRPFFTGERQGVCVGGGVAWEASITSKRQQHGKDCDGRAREDTLRNDIYPVLAALQPTKAIYTHIDHSLLFY